MRATDLRHLPEIPDLRIDRALEGGARGAALDIGGEARVTGDDVGVAQHRRHHQVAGGGAVAVEIGLVAKAVGEGGNAFGVSVCIRR
jgi:hypothetical protein